jgi:hypothetical protein
MQEATPVGASTPIETALGYTPTSDDKDIKKQELKIAPADGIQFINRTTHHGPPIFQPPAPGDALARVLDFNLDMQ